MTSFFLQTKSYWTRSGLKCLDFLLMLGLGIFVYHLRFSPVLWGAMQIKQYYFLLILIVSALNFVVFILFNVYDNLRGRSLSHIFIRLLKPFLVLIFIISLFALLTKTGALYSRIWLVSWLGSSFILMYGYRVLFIQLFKYLRAKGFNTRHIVLIGSGELLDQAKNMIETQASMGYVISQVINPVEDLDLALILKEFNPDEIWMALPLKQEDLIKNLLHQVRFSTTPIYLIPDLLGLTLLKQKILEIAGLPVISLKTSPIMGFNAVLKWLEDKILATLICIILSPVFILIGVGVKLSSPGPVLFKQKRYGINNQEINVYKFRTMKLHQESNPDLVTQAKKEDPRITKFGRFLRRTSLDELPQFFNVLQGKMSIVGPRPHAVSHNEMYKNLINAYMMRHIVKPGITGWAQVNGFRGETDTLEKMQRRVEYDLFYIDHWSLGLDLKIIFLTVYKGFVNKNAY